MGNGTPFAAFVHTARRLPNRHARGALTGDFALQGALFGNLVFHLLADLCQRIHHHVMECSERFLGGSNG
jgi:hypothetical protein